ncbi:MAG: hypothetical protein FWH04_07645 [Oscillospiraceae bacterium]|nr:hypothetical protein [Oscillospiraceae bacterium]
MKKLRFLALIFSAVLFSAFLTGCAGNAESKTKDTSENAADVTQEPINSPSPQLNLLENPDVANAQPVDDGERVYIKDPDPNFDLDLTALDDNSAYWEVCDMLITPDEYKGKTIKASSSYMGYPDAESGQYNHMIVYGDTEGCCIQYIEFSWPDGREPDPSEFPKENEIVEISGVFTSRYDEAYEWDFPYLELDNITTLEEESNP